MSVRAASGAACAIVYSVRHPLRHQGLQATGGKIVLKRYIKTGYAAAALGALLLPGCGMLPADPPGAVAPPAAPRLLPGAGQARVPGQYLVTLAQGAEVAAISAVYGQLGVKQIQPVVADVYLLTLRDDPGPETMETLGKRDARIKAVQPNFVYRIQPRGAPQ